MTGYRLIVRVLAGIFVGLLVLIAPAGVATQPIRTASPTTDSVTVVVGDCVKPGETTGYLELRVTNNSKKLRRYELTVTPTNTTKFISVAAGATIHTGFQVVYAGHYEYTVYIADTTTLVGSGAADVPACPVLTPPAPTAVLVCLDATPVIYVDIPSEEDAPGVQYLINGSAVQGGGTHTLYDAIYVLVTAEPRSDAPDLVLTGQTEWDWDFGDGMCP